MAQYTNFKQKKKLHILCRWLPPTRRALLRPETKPSLKRLPCRAQLEHFPAPARVPLTPGLLFSTLLPVSRAEGGCASPAQDSALCSASSRFWEKVLETGSELSYSRACWLPAGRDMGCPEPGMAARLLGLLAS